MNRVATMPNMWDGDFRCLGGKSSCGMMIAALKLAITASIGGCVMRKLCITYSLNNSKPIAIHFDDWLEFADWLKLRFLSSRVCPLVIHNWEYIYDA